MAWTDADLKIFAAGLAIGGKWNHTHGTLPRVKSSVPSGTYWYTQYFTLSCDIAQATILYSVDGSTPTTVYQGEEIYIGETMVVYAYAIYGQGLSAMSRFIYTIDNPLDKLSEDWRVRMPMTEGDLSIVVQSVTLSPEEDFAVDPLRITGERVDTVL